MSLYSIDIRNFRGIKDISLSDFKNVNLLVGKNNCGKTSILEAIFLSVGVSNPQLAISIDSFRGLMHDKNDDFNFIFFNLNPENSIDIKTQFTGPSQYRHLIINPIIKKAETDININKSIELSSTSSTSINKEISGVNFDFSVKTILQSKDHFLKSSIEIKPGEIKIQQAKDYAEKIVGVFLNQRANNGQELHSRLDKIIQKKEQKKIIQTLTIIDPRIVDLSLGSKNMIYFDIGIDRLIPIQLMGDGINKLLLILVTIANHENGIVIIDEIENGFHASTLALLWGLIKDASMLYNVQVFATTHSMECVKTFSDTFNILAQEKDLSRLFRIEKAPNDTFSTFKYDSEVLKAAVDNNWEVR